MRTATKFFKLDGKWVGLEQVVQFGKNGGKYGHGWEVILSTGLFLPIHHRPQAEALAALLDENLVLDLDLLAPVREEAVA